MNELDFREEQFFKILNLSRDIWEDKINDKKLNIWLENFDYDENIKDCEQAHAMYLLSNFTYFGVREIRELLKSAYRDKVKNPLMQRIRKENQNSKDFELISKEYERELQLTRFVGVGNPSESGPHLLYFFRQENSLGKDLFIDTHRILKFSRQGAREEGKVDITLSDDTLKRYIFLDDLCGSGDQVIEYAEDITKEIKSIDSSMEICYITLVATQQGLNKVKSTNIFDKVETIFELDDSYKCFSESSRYFSERLKAPVNKEFARRTSEKHGSKLLGPTFCHGYSDGQLLLGFSHNTPDNTLPIFWCEDPTWNAIFKRYYKM